MRGVFWWLSIRVEVGGMRYEGDGTKWGNLVEMIVCVGVVQRTAPGPF